jgi:transketolase
LIPFASSFAAFGTGRVYEQIRICICWTNLNVKIVVTHAGISVGEDGVSHQMMEDISLMRVLPNMKVIVPCDGVEAEKAILASADSFGPTYIRLGRAKFPIILPSDYEFRIGKAHVMIDGEDATIIATGIMVGEALKAHKYLNERGISTRVINMSTIKPIDEELIIKAAEETGGIVTAEEHSIIGGLGSAITEVLSEHAPVPIKRVGIKDKFGMSGAPRELLEKFEMTDTHIVRAVYEVIEHKKSGKHVVYGSSAKRI